MVGVEWAEGLGFGGDGGERGDGGGGQPEPAVGRRLLSPPSHCVALSRMCLGLESNFGRRVS